MQPRPAGRSGLNGEESWSEMVPDLEVRVVPKQSGTARNAMSCGSGGWDLNPQPTE